MEIETSAIERTPVLPTSHPVRREAPRRETEASSTLPQRARKKSSVENIRHERSSFGCPRPGRPDAHIQPGIEVTNASCASHCRLSVPRENGSLKSNGFCPYRSDSNQRC